MMRRGMALSLPPRLSGSPLGPKRPRRRPPSGGTGAAVHV